MPRKFDSLALRSVQGGELFDRIAECGGLAEEEAKRYFAQILQALAHCHENRVYHRDLKPENILLDANDNAKVADFGLAAVYRHVAGGAAFLQHTKVGSVMYAAPEVLTSTAASGYDAARADTWSLGVILFSMLSGTLPFTCAAASKCKRYAAVLTHGIGVMCPEHLSPQVTLLLSRLLHPDPRQRMTPQEALLSDWVRGGLPTWPRMPRPLDHQLGARSWTITMRVPNDHVVQLASATGARGGRVAGAAIAASSGAIMGDACAPESAVGKGMNCYEVSGTIPPSDAVEAESGMTAKRKRADVTAGSGEASRCVRHDDPAALPSQSPGTTCSICGTVTAATLSTGASAIGDDGSMSRARVMSGVSSSSSSGIDIVSRKASAGATMTVAEGGQGPSPSQQQQSSLSAQSQHSSLSVQPTQGQQQQQLQQQQQQPRSAVSPSLATATGSSSNRTGGSSGGVNSGGGSCAGYSPLSSLAGLPLRGCVSEYVERFGWEPLPHGTEQLLRDILQTLRSMGLQYRLEEQHSPARLSSGSAGQLSSGPGSSGGEVSAGEMRTHRLTLTILF